MPHKVGDTKKSRDRLPTCPTRVKMDRETLWLWLCSADGVGPTTANALWSRLCERGLALEDFYALGETDWAGEFGLNARMVKGLTEQKLRMSAIVDLAESLREADAHLISLEAPQYPASVKASLNRSAPPLLYAVGNVSLLEQKAVAVVGARDASPRGLTIARGIGEAVTRHGLVLVSGGAKGVDDAAHRGALAGGGATIVVLSCGILRSRPTAEFGEQADPRSTLYLSELDPNMTWQVGGAMARNRIVCGLTSAVVVVEAKESGGTMDAARKAMELRKPLFVVQFDRYDAHSAGNASLLRKGGRPLPAQYDSTTDSWRVDIEPILTLVEGAAPPQAPSGQSDLFSP